jgi:hypothetical protein
MMSAVRSTQRRPEPVAEMDGLQRAAASLQPDRQPAAMDRSAPAATQSVEVRAATSPSPDEIRARAEEVRQRAMAARALRDSEERRSVTVIDDEPELFNVDRSSIDAGPQRSEANAQLTARPRAEAGLAGERRPTINPLESESRGNTARAGLFAINRLIHRVAGAAQPDPSAGSNREAQRRSDGADEDEGEIPAFLRRQAN